MDFGNQILSITLDYIKKGLTIPDIMVPSNCSFMTNEVAKKAIDMYFKAFKEEGTTLRLSASIDGKIVEEKNRPFKGLKGGVANTIDLKDQKYYDDLAEFFKQHNWGLHPMIDASTIEYQKENYLW